VLKTSRSGLALDYDTPEWAEYFLLARRVYSVETVVELVRRAFPQGSLGDLQDVGFPQMTFEVRGGPEVPLLRAQRAIRVWGNRRTFMVSFRRGQGVEYVRVLADTAKDAEIILAGLALDPGYEGPVTPMVTGTMVITEQRDWLREQGGYRTIKDYLARHPGPVFREPPVRYSDDF